MKYASMIKPAADGGYFVMWSDVDYTNPRPKKIQASSLYGKAMSVSDLIKNSEVQEVTLRLDRFENLDDFDPENIARVFERMGLGGEKGKNHRVFKVYEYYDENGDLLEPQPTDLINFRSGLFGYMSPSELKQIVDFHNSDPKYFEGIKTMINEKSSHTIDLVEVFAEVENKPMRKHLVIQLKTKVITAPEE